MLFVVWLLPYFVTIAIVSIFYANKIGRKTDWLLGASLTVVNALGLITDLDLNYVVRIGTWSARLGADCLIDQNLTNSGFVLTLLIVSALVQGFANWYMASEPFKNSFVGALALFGASMTLFILSSDMLTLFLAWELIGLASFFLIGFNQTRVKANVASLKAVFTNKIGDMALLVALGLLLLGVSGGNLRTISEVGVQDNFLIGLLILAMMAKSAQSGLHGWLLSAMEGPTPVSALLHSATMVTAGVYLILKTNIASAADYWVSAALAVIGLSTAILAAVEGLSEDDLKKTVAYSTLFNLGMMVFALPNGELAMAHLLGHALPKAILFISCGMLIHKIGSQYIDAMGGTANINVVEISLIFGCAIAGFGLAGEAGVTKEHIFELIPQLSLVYIVYFGVLLLIVGTALAYLSSLGSLWWGQYTSPSRPKIYHESVLLHFSLVLVLLVAYSGWLAGGYWSLGSIPALRVENISWRVADELIAVPGLVVVILVLLIAAFGLIAVDTSEKSRFEHENIVTIIFIQYARLVNKSVV